jgi:hypothetical protein
MKLSTCIRCARIMSPVPNARAEDIPFRSYYCAHCAEIRRVEREREGYSNTPIVEQRA